MSAIINLDILSKFSELKRQEKKIKSELEKSRQQIISALLAAFPSDAKGDVKTPILADDKGRYFEILFQTIEIMSLREDFIIDYLKKCGEIDSRLLKAIKTVEVVDEAELTKLVVEGLIPEDTVKEFYSKKPQEKLTFRPVTDAQYQKTQALLPSSVIASGESDDLLSAV